MRVVVVMAVPVSVIVVVMIMLVIMIVLVRIHGCLNAMDAVAFKGAHEQVEVAGMQLAEFAGEFVRIHAEPDQRAEDHVAARAPHAVEAQDLHDGSPTRLIIAPQTPAPNPLSTFTTETPGAHEFSIASSAVSPPKFMP